MKGLLLIVFFFSCSFLVGQNRVDNDSSIVHQLIQAEFDAVWSDLDTTALLEYHTEDFLLLEHGEVWNNDTIRVYQVKAGKRENRPKRINRFEMIEVRSFPGAIYASYHNYASFQENGKESFKLQWLESVIAIETKQGWRLKQMHSTRVPLDKKK